MLTCPAPIIDRGLDEAGLGEVISHNLRLGCHNIGITLFESACNVAMQLLATTPHKTCVGSLLHERMLEQVRGIRRCSTLKNQLGTNELRECGLKIPFRESGYGSDQAVGELSTDDGADLRHVLH